MTSPSTTFDLTRFDALRRAHGTTLGTPMSAVAETGSTNDDAAAAARTGAPHGATFLADLQTAGRGRRGHRWSSAVGENLTFSIILKPRVDAAQVSALTLVAGAAVRAAVAEYVPEPVHIKWPNDIVVGRRKLAGILVESQLAGDQVECVVVGIGLNVRARKFPEDLAGIATSLALLSDPAPDREDVLARILAEFEPRVVTFVEQGLASALREVRLHDALLGRSVVIDTVSGTADGIGDDGALLVQTDAGSLARVSSGNVLW